MLNHKTNAGFQTTQWTLLDALNCGDADARRCAQETLATLYWPPVYAAFRKWPMGREDAAEATQAFFAEVVLGRRLFERAKMERGRLRTLLCKAVHCYAIDLHRRNRSGLNGVTFKGESLGREEQFIARLTGTSVEEAFDRCWARRLLERAVEQCRTAYEDTGRETHWRAFEDRVVRPAITGNQPPSLADVATRCGFTNAAHAAVIIHNVKLRCRAALRGVIAETLDRGLEFDDEFEYISSLLQATP